MVGVEEDSVVVAADLVVLVEVGVLAVVVQAEAGDYDLFR